MKESHYLFYKNNITGESWKEWKLKNECSEEEIEKANIRQIKPYELFLDLEDKKQISVVLSKIKSDNFKINGGRWDTGSRGEHLLLLFPELKNYDQETRTNIRKILIKRYGCDLSKASDKTLIAREDKPHFKTGNKKSLIFKERGKNKISRWVWEELKKINELNQQEEINYSIDKETIKEDQMITYLLAGNVIKQGDRNSKLLKNLGIMLQQAGYDKITAKPIATAIIKSLPKKSVSELLSWIEWSKKNNGKINFFELNSFIELHNLPIQKYEVIAEKINYFYDQNKMWWVWNDDLYCWEISDDVDILNLWSHGEVSSMTTDPKQRQTLLNELKQRGRRQKPQEAPKTWIQFKNTIIDIKNSNEFKATPKYFVTNPLPYSLGKSDYTPTIDKLFREWVVPKEDLEDQGLEQDESFIDTLYEIIAYCCCSEQFLQRVVALVGSGSNGKGTFLKLIGKFLGKKNTCSSTLKLFSTRFETSGIYKKLVVFFGEVDTGDLVNPNTLKSLTGEDDIRFEFKGKTPFSEYSSATPIIATNALPLTPDKSVGFYRRWLIIDFCNQFQIKRDLLATVPEEEFRNLGLKIINILKELYESNAFTNEGNIEERTLKYEARSHPLITFIENCCEEGAGMIELRVFSNFFNQYLQNKKLRPYTIHSIGKLLRSEGFEISPRKIEENGEVRSVKAIINISLKSNIERLVQNGSLGSKTPKLDPKPDEELLKLPKLPKSATPQYSNKKSFLCEDTTKTTKKFSECLSCGLKTDLLNEKGLCELCSKEPEEIKEI